MGAALSDLKGALCEGFCNSRVACISAVLSVDPQPRQWPETCQMRASGIKAALYAPESCFICQHPVPSGEEDRESWCSFSSLEIPVLRTSAFSFEVIIEEYVRLKLKLHPLHPAALASVPSGKVLVRVRVLHHQISHIKIS